METIQERAERLADSLVETVAKAGYLPQNRTYTSLEIKEFADGLAEEIAAELQAAVDAERERCAKIVEGYGEFDLTDLFDDGYETGMAIVAAAIRQGDDE